jgi:hypothetical protein
VAFTYLNKGTANKSNWLRYKDGYRGEEKRRRNDYLLMRSLQPGICARVVPVDVVVIHNERYGTLSACQSVDALPIETEPNDGRSHSMV